MKKENKLDGCVGRALDWIRRACPLESTQLGIHDEDHRVDDLGLVRQSHADELRQMIRAVPDLKDTADRIDAESLRAHLSETLLMDYEYNLPERAAGFMAEQFLSALFHQS